MSRYIDTDVVMKICILVMLICVIISNHYLKKIDRLNQKEKVMSRYIDAEWLIKESMPLDFSVQKWVNEVQIMTAPSIDIVRCKECKRHGMDDCPMWEGAITEDYMFCSYGERKK